MDIKLDQDAMRAVLTKALFDNMSEEQKAEIMKGAIEGLLKQGDSSRTSYGEKPLSPIEKAVREAAASVAHTEARKRLSESREFNDALDTLMADAVKKLFAEGAREKLIDKIVDGTIKAFDRY